MFIHLKRENKEILPAVSFTPIHTRGSVTLILVLFFKVAFLFFRNALKKAIFSSLVFLIYNLLIMHSVK